jgi:ribosome-associated protein
MAERKTREAKRDHGKRSQKLARELMNLLEAKLDELVLDEHLMEAIKDSRRHTSLPARRREERRLGGVLREYDLDEVEAALHAATAEERAAAALFKKMERWRERVIDSDAGLAAFAEATGVEVDDGWRAAVDDARRERDTGRPRGAAKALFKKVRSAMDAAG